MARSPKLTDFQLLNIIPEPNTDGISIKQMREFFNKNGIQTNEPNIYSRIRVLDGKGLVNMYAHRIPGQFYGTREPLLCCLTARGVTLRDEFREEYKKEHGEYPQKVNILESNGTDGGIKNERYSIPAFLTKYRIGS